MNSLTFKSLMFSSCYDAECIQNKKIKNKKGSEKPSRGFKSCLSFSLWKIMSDIFVFLWKSNCKLTLAERNRNDYL